MIFNNNGKPFSEAIKGVDKIIHTDCNRKDVTKTARFHLITKEEGIQEISLEEFEELDSNQVLRLDAHYENNGRYFGLDPEYVYDALLRAQK